MDLRELRELRTGSAGSGDGGRSYEAFTIGARTAPVGAAHGPTLEASRVRASEHKKEDSEERANPEPGNTGRLKKNSLVSPKLHRSRVDIRRASRRAVPFPG
jgi:hypothetical protein